MLTHIDEKQNPKMVDVSSKSPTLRKATATGIIKMSELAKKTMLENSGKKGSVVQTAIVAAIMGAKKTSELIPMCHPLSINGVDTDLSEVEGGFKLEVSVKIEGKTGVEMEALTGVSIGLLTIYDMLKAVDKSMEICQISLAQKSGGKSGDYRREK